MRKTMNSNLIFFDIDGTILSHRTFTISDSTRAAIKQAQAKGNLAFLNTGRTLAEMGDDILNVGFDGGVYRLYSRICETVKLRQYWRDPLQFTMIRNIRTRWRVR